MMKTIHEKCVLLFVFTLLLSLITSCSSTRPPASNSDIPSGSRRAPLSVKQEQEFERIDRSTKQMDSAGQANIPSVHFERGKAQHALGRYNEAIADLNEAIRLKPNFSEAYAKLSECFVAKGQPFEAQLAQGWSEYHNGKLELAAQAFSDAIRLNPKQSKAWWGRSNVYLAKGQSYEALIDLDYVIALDPLFPDTYFERGKIFQSVKRQDLAVMDFSTLLSLNPRHVEGLHERGEAFSSLGEQDKALTDFGQVLQLDPRHAKARISRAQVFLAKGDLTRAWTDADEALKIIPDMPQASVVQATILLRNNQKEAAVQRFDEVVRRSPHYTAEAIAAYEQIISQVPQLGAAYHARGVAYYQKGLFPKAADDLTQALTMTVDAPQVLYDRGMVHLRNGNSRQAIGDFEAALKLRSSFKGTILSEKAYLIKVDYKSEARVFNQIGGLRDPDIYKNLAWAYYFDNNTEQALHTLKMAMERNKYDHEAYFFAGLIHAKTGELPTALTFVETAMRLEPQIKPYQETLAKLRQEKQRKDFALQMDGLGLLIFIGSVMAAHQDLECQMDAACSFRRQQEIQNDQARRQSDLVEAIAKRHRKW